MKGNARGGLTTTHEGGEYVIHENGGIAGARVFRSFYKLVGNIERTNTHAPRDREHSVGRTNPYRTLNQERGADPTSGSDLYLSYPGAWRSSHDKCNFRPGVAITPVYVMSVK